MNKLVVPLVLLVLVPLGAAPAQAATTNVVVDGFDYPSTLSYVYRDCDTTSFDGTTTALYRAGGAIGTHATGLRFASTIGEAGVQASVATPSALTEVSFETLHPSGAAGSSPGSFYVSIDPDGTGFQSYYYANVNLNVNYDTWGAWNLESFAFDWFYWDGVSSSASDVDTTIAQFATDHGNGSGARFGFLFGCDGRDYYMDNLRIGVGSTTTVYDFEGVPSATYLSTFGSHHSDMLVQDLRRLTLITGQRHWLAGDSWSFGDGVIGTGWFNGTARLFAKGYGQSSFRFMGSSDFTTEDHAWFEIRPRKNTVYRVDTPGTNTFEPSGSLTLKVSVKRRVSVRIADTTIFRGRSIKFSGVIKPRDAGVRVSAQHKTRSGWQTIAKGITRTGGKYSLAPRAGSAGKWLVRVVVAGGKGNVGNKSRTATVTVKVPPPKPVKDVETPTYIQPEPTPVPHEPTGPKPGRVMVRQLYQLFWGLDLMAPAPVAGPASGGVEQLEPR
ncbi:hypothetical protein ISU10_03210 [Nocardioides agariphilus]|uniref:Uncharacterized protein n=1 Tax=Nocardioides agariphilus TaxID=433664 RepID=A0A930VFX2_9ACTN|nr:hypothetical protein [Nocardioides agariphilus]MBF4766774.1 hypothetical protein [Nocardioides agariphilus]